MDSMDAEFQLELEDSAEASEIMDSHCDDADSSDDDDPDSSEENEGDSMESSDSSEETEGDSSEETEGDSSEETDTDSSEDDRDSREDTEAWGEARAEPSVDMKDSCELVVMKPSEDMEEAESEPTACMSLLLPWLPVDMLDRLLEGKEVMELALVSELSSLSCTEPSLPPPSMPRLA